ncbi:MULTISPECIES: aminotransferase class III-fold pyridoxal phosphate-dependent enzyme [unclassified Flavobacterium]|uniref:aspartate aminotransferase family protein n=1 Tax=unclassified Flavobacterium TaxID=196869 RepID=UPI000959FA23|nr:MULTISPECIES: aminotransferase class III-fold pyridoxal phosphate-dependent enzyme [unclassified Flavobacterium]MBN9284228.1 aspartate aminotransferase family protein [Flavobacterium sp.]OJV70691.1 MAG: aspartate aminotransferase family protein [Flavobacterium sp. 40-81]
MNLFNVYPIYNITPTRAMGAKVWDANNQEYLDFYGGHGVISIGHSHTAYVNAITGQVQKIGFYSNSIVNPIQEQLAQKTAQLSGYPDYSLFLCNSGAEANENALKLASFHNGKSRIIAFQKAFHGRTSAAVAVTDNPAIIAPVNNKHEVVFLPLNDIGPVTDEIAKGDVCAVIIEGIQGVGGLDEGTTAFFQALQQLCKAHNVILILDEIQSGYGRSGKFFAHQHHGIQPDIISMAKGMGNGFPVGGILISPGFKASYGLLGTTFGGNHLACAAALSVLETIEKEALIDNVRLQHDYFCDQMQQFPEIKKVKGRGLMLGLVFDFDVSELRQKLIYEEYIFTGNAAQKNLLRILPPLSITKDDTDYFVKGLKNALATLT